MNEREVISSVLGGDTRRFEILVDRYLPVVRGLCAGRIANPSAHDDLVQETFIQSYVHLDRLRDPDRFGPWLVTIAKNKCHEWLRQQGRRERLAERLADRQQPTVDPIPEADQKELREWVQRRIAALPEKLRDAMTLCYGEGLSTAEAARLLGVREPALRKRLQYGREAIGAELMAQYRGDPSSEKSEQLREKVLAAVPLGTVPWRGAGASIGLTSAGLGSKATLFVLPMVAIVLCLSGALLLHRNRQSPSSPSSRPVTQAVRSSVLATGAIEVQVHAGTNAEGVSIANLPVKAMPIHWDGTAWEEMLRAAGIPVDYADLLAPTMRDNVPKERLKESWQRQGLKPARIAEAEKHLNTFWLAFMEGRLPAGTRNPLQGDLDRERIATTNEEGHATLGSLSEGTYSIQAIVASSGRTYAGGASVPLKARQTARVDVTLLPMGCPAPDAANADPVLGVVINGKTGEPVAGVHVEIGTSQDFVSSGFVQTDEQGNFRFGLLVFPYGTLYARVSVDEALSKTVAFEHRESQTERVELRLFPRGVVSGRVTSADGLPAPKVPIMLKSVRGDSARSVAHTDDDGHYSFAHDGGALVLKADGDSVETEPVTLELGVDESRTLDFVLPDSASASFDLLLPDGSRPDKIRANVLWSDEHSNRLGKELSRQGDFFVLPYLKPAAYRVLLHADGFETALEDFVIDEKLIDVTQSLHLKPAEISARILLQDAQGKPVTNRRIYAMWRYGRKFDTGEDISIYSATSIAEVETGPDGIAEFNGLPPGRYDFDTDGPLQLRDIDVPCNRLLATRESAADTVTSRALPLEFYPFRLVDPDKADNPLNLRDAAIFAVDDSGNLNATEMGVGAHTIYVIKRGYTAGVCRVTVTPKQLDPEKPSPTEPADVVLGKGGSISGYINGTDVAGKDLAVYPEEVWEAACADLMAEAPDARAWTWEWARFGRTLAQHVSADHEGRFTLRFLPPGRYVLATDTDKPGVLLVSDPVTVVPGQETSGVELTELTTCN